MPPTIDPGTVTVGQLVTEKPARSRLFEQLQIDFCCGGKRSLREACQEKGLDADTVARMIEAFEPHGASADERDWTKASPTELADHIESTHHAFLRRELPRLGQMVRKVSAVHGQTHSWLLELDGVFNGFVGELESHMLKEEQVLFPMIRELEQGRCPSPEHCSGGTVANPIRVMEHEHDDAGAALARMRELSSGFAPPEGACNTFVAMLDGLGELEADMHRHVHKENHILFPAASALEQQVRGSSAASAG